MNAVRVNSFGGALDLAQVEVPAPGPGELQIRVEAIGLNWSDLLQRAGAYPGGPKPPYVIGQEAAGVVVAHGDGVSSPPIGARVSVIGRGLCAERANVRANSVIAWELDVEQRAALPIALLTAHYALVTRGRARRGETVLIDAAAGGVGHIATQVAKALGLHVIATCSASKREHVIGADVVCEYGELREVAKDGVDLVIDGVGGDAFRDGISVLRPHGRIVLVGFASGELPTFDPVKLLYKSHTVMGAHLKNAFADRAVLECMVSDCVDLAKTVRAKVTTMPFAEIEAAYQRLGRREVVGKLVVTM